MYGMGEPRIKIVAMPKDTNPSGFIFGGWIMSQIDVAGALAARDVHPERVVTVAVNSMEFKKPVKVGDSLSCYAKIVKIGRSSIQTLVEVVAERMEDDGWSCVHVTSALITYVSVDQEGNTKPLHPDAKRLVDLDFDHPNNPKDNQGAGI